MKEIEVAAAVIYKEDKYFLTQRGYGEFKDKWEFPGGKIETNESKQQAVIREIKEELNANIKIDKYLGKVEYTYTNFHLIMHLFLCELLDDSLTLLEAENACWCKKEDINKLDLLPADVLALKYL